jgi:hypothetical protein
MITFTVSQVVNAIPSSEHALLLMEALIDAFPDIMDDYTPSVDKMYDNMSLGERAHMFNKLLKHEDYNPRGTSITKLNVAAIACLKAQYPEDSES